MLKENCRKQMNHINMLETRLKQITKKTKLAEQETLIDKIQHSIEYFDHLTVKDSPPTLVGAIFTFIVPIVLIILGVSKWNEYNESTNLFTTTTYFTSASRNAFQQQLSASHVVLKWETLKVVVPCQTYCDKVPAMLMERFAQHLMNAASQVVGYASLGAANGADFESKRLYSACKFNTECQTNFCGKLRYYILHAYKNE